MLQEGDYIANGIDHLPRLYVDLAIIRNKVDVAHTKFITCDSMMQVDFTRVFFQIGLSRKIGRFK